MRKLYILLFSLFILSGAFAQVDLEVHVTELLTSNPVSNATVTLTNTVIGYSESGNTDAQGKIKFKGLSISGTYSALVGETNDYFGQTLNDITLRSNYNPSITIALAQKKEIALGDVVVNGSRSQQINTVNAEVSSELKIAEIEEIPVEGRDITRVLYRLPNVVQATGFYPEAPNVSINGSNSLYTNYLIDGMDNNEQFLGGERFAMPVGFTQNITVLTNNFSAEYGLTANGVVNITSRSGNNDFSGEAYFITRPGSVIDAESPYTQHDLSGNAVKDGFQRYQEGVAFGGPIKKDKTFYYIDVEQTTDLKDNLLSSPELGVNETVRGANNFTLLSGKIDQKWNAHFHSSLRLNAGIVGIGRQAGGLDGGVTFPSAANTQDRNSYTVALKNNYVGKNFSEETNYEYARFDWNYADPVNPDEPQVTVLDPDQLPVAVLGNPGYIFEDIANTHQFQQKFNFYRGKHTFKTGLEIISTKHVLYGGGNPNGNYTVQLTDEQLAEVAALGSGAGLDVNDIPLDAEVLDYNVELRPAGFGATQNVFSLYAEDEIAFTGKLTATLGLRYDYDNLSKGGSDKGDFNNLGPRISANYKINNKNSIRAGWGIFYDKINYAVYSDALQQNSTNDDYKTEIQQLVDLGILPASTDIDQVTFEGNLSADLSGVDYLAGPTADELQSQRDFLFSGERRILNPNGYQNPYSSEFMVGYQYQVSNNKIFYVDLVYNHSYDLFRLVDLNAPAAYPIIESEDFQPDDVRSQEEADLTRPIPIYDGSYAIINGDTVTGIARTVTMTETAGESKYYAASFNFQKDRGDDKYAFRLIYTLSLLKNNTEDINFKAMDANDFDAEWGPSINDRTHVINGIVTLYPVKSLSLTLAALLQSGQPINRIPDASIYGTTDLNGDGRSFGDAYVGNSDREPGETRNNDRLPWSDVFDLGAQYDFTFGSGKLMIRADVFNVFNAENLSGYSNNATQSNQIQIGPSGAGSTLVRRNSGAPRQFQFGISYTF